MAMELAELPIFEVRGEVKSRRRERELDKAGGRILQGGRVSGREIS